MAADELLVQARARIGLVLGTKYRLDRLLGVGGMASVYEATHVRNRGRVAVKVLHPQLAADYELRERFLREGYAANVVGQTGAVRILDDDRAHDGLVYLVMELLQGETLDARWERCGRRLPVREVVAIVRDLLAVLEKAHARGVVHRDSKPDNIFVTEKDGLKILDFGVARLQGAVPTQTEVGSVFGTPAFMPPEQALGRTRQVDAVSDVWAVGAIAFTLLSGRYVHSGETAREMMVSAATCPAPFLINMDLNIPAALARVIDRALAFDKERRWQSAAAMREALRDVSEDDLNASDPPPPEPFAEDTRLAPPPRMTEPDIAQDGSNVPTVPRASRPTDSTVAGLVTSGDHARPREPWRLVARIAAAVSGAMLVVALGILTAALARGPGASSAAAAGAPAAPSAATLASVRGSVPPPASASAARAPAPPEVDVELLPKATSPSRSRGKSAAIPSRDGT